METWLTSHPLLLLQHYVMTLLDQLGRASTEVAGSLEKNIGIHGQRFARRCLNPLVQHVTRKVPGCWAAEIIEDKICLYFLDVNPITVALPRAGLDFLEEFDQGKYPHLELNRNLELNRVGINALGGGASPCFRKGFAQSARAG